MDKIKDGKCPTAKEIKRLKMERAKKLYSNEIIRK